MITYDDYKEGKYSPAGHQACLNTRQVELDGGWLCDDRDSVEEKEMRE
jgi:hypothetical protein